jgi:hypothetical protein
VTALRLGEGERELARDEVSAVLALTADVDRREGLERLLAEIDGRSVAGDGTEALDRIVSLGLQSGRIRALYGPGGEQAALRLYRKLPGGAALQASAADVSEALGALRGKSVEAISITPAGPGRFTLSISAGGLELSLRLDDQGVRLSSVGV